MQDTQELTTPNGHTVLIRGFVTGLIDQQIQKILKSGGKYSVSVAADTMTDPAAAADQAAQNVDVQIDPSVEVDADAKLLELMVLAVDGNNGDTYNTLDELAGRRYQYRIS